MTVKKIGEVNGLHIYEADKLNSKAQKNAITIKTRGKIRDFIYSKIRDIRAKLYANVIFFRHKDKWICIGKWNDIRKIAK